VKPYGCLAHGKNMNLKYDLVRPDTVVGRSDTCDIQLVDPYVSRRQARIVKEAERILIENVGRNPILINGEAVRKSVLQSGDMLLFGKTQMVFQLVPQIPEVSTDSGESDLDPEMTFLLPDHQSVRKAEESASVDGSTKNMMLAWIALGLILLAVVVYVFF
jgi:pSer/pThr/pTyr-binding forkhead associated (FHA) protein